MRGYEISKTRNHITSPRTHRATIVCRIKGIPLNILNNLQSIIEIGLKIAGNLLLPLVLKLSKGLFL
jgi:hypothetical protein